MCVLDCSSNNCRYGEFLTIASRVRRKTNSCLLQPNSGVGRGRGIRYRARRCPSIPCRLLSILSKIASDCLSVYTNVLRKTFGGDCARL